MKKKLPIKFNRGIKLFRRRYLLSELYAMRNFLYMLLLSPKKIFNLFLVKVSLFFKMKKCLGLPLNILIEPTGSCNYQCVKCERFSSIYKDDGDVFKDKNMPLEYYRQIIDDIGDTLLTLRLWHYGEPFLNGDIFDMIKYAKRKNIIVAISSNLSLLTEEKSKKLIQSGLDYLVVSFDGASNETYSLYHRRDYFDKVVNNIRTLIKLKKSLKSSLPFVELQFIIMKENEKEMEQVKNIARELGVDKLVYQRVYIDRLDLKKFEGFNSNKDLLPTNKDFCLDMRKIRSANFCRIPWEETLIRYSGAVLPCAVDLSQKYEIGNLFQQDGYLGFRNLWNNYKYLNFRQQIIKDINKIDICFNCAQRNNNIEEQVN